MSRQPQLDPKSGAREAAECVGFLAMGVGAVMAWSGKLTIDKLIGYGATVEAAVSTFISVWLIPVLVCLIGTVVTIAVLRLVLQRAGTIGIRSKMHYRRRWVSAMNRSELIKESAGEVLVPKLRSVRTGPDHDQVRVRMTAGQSPVDFHHKAAKLAAEFGAAEVQVEMDAADPLTNVGLTFWHQPRPGRRAPLKELEATKSPNVLWMQPRSAREPVRARAEKASIQIEWARIRLLDSQGRKLAGGLWGLRMKWGWSWTTAAM